MREGEVCHGPFRTSKGLTKGRGFNKSASGCKKTIDGNAIWELFQLVHSELKTNEKEPIYMNKAELVESVQKSLGGDTSKAAAERAVAAVIDGIEKGLKKDKSVQLIGFGTFSVAKRAARQGINPQTGEKIKIKASKTVKFKVGASLKEKI
jgi:nucleoid DNA-binding protein